MPEVVWSIESEMWGLSYLAYSCRVSRGILADREMLMTRIGGGTCFIAGIVTSRNGSRLQRSTKYWRHASPPISVTLP